MYQLIFLMLLVLPIDMMLFLWVMQLRALYAAV